MTVKKNYSYGCDVDTLFDLVTSEDGLKRKYESCGARNVSITRCDEQGDTRTIEWSREMPADPPGFAKKFMAEWNKLTETLTWTRKGDKVEGKYNGSVSGVPGALQGDFTIEPDGGGCREVISMAAEIKVPLVGKKIAAVVEEDVDKNLDKEDAFHQSETS